MDTPKNNTSNNFQFSETNDSKLYDIMNIFQDPHMLPILVECSETYIFCCRLAILKLWLVVHHKAGHQVANGFQSQERRLFVTGLRHCCYASLRAIAVGPAFPFFVAVPAGTNAGMVGSGGQWWPIVPNSQFPYAPCMVN